MSSTVGGSTGFTFPDGTTQSTAATTPSSVANLSGGAAGKIPYQSAADTTSFTAVGTSGQPLVSGGTGSPAFRPYTLPASDGTNGQVLQTNGSGALSFATPGGGSWILLSTVTASNSSTVDIETTFDSTYDNYVILGSGIVPTNNDDYMSGRLKINGSYQTTGYSYTVSAISTTTDLIPISRGTNQSYFRMHMVDYTYGNANGRNASFTMWITNPSSTTLLKTVKFEEEVMSSTNLATAVVSYHNGTATYYNGTEALTGVRLYFILGTIASGTFRLYGIKNS